MKPRALILLLACLLHACGPGIAFAADPTISIVNPDQTFTINATAPLTEATAKRLFAGAPHAAFGTVSATTDGAANFPARVARRRVGWINASTETVYIAFAAGVTGTTGLTVPANGTGGMNYTGAVYVHSASGSARVDFAESYD